MKPKSIIKENMQNRKNKKTREIKVKLQLLI